MLAQFFGMGGQFAHILLLLDGIFDRFVPLYLQTDKGKEFYNAHVTNVLSMHNIIHFSTENDNIKASIVERFNQTLRVILHRTFTKLGRYRYLDILDDVIRSYNNRDNRKRCSSR